MLRIPTSGLILIMCYISIAIFHTIDNNPLHHGGILESEVPSYAKIECQDGAKVAKIRGTHFQTMYRKIFHEDMTKVSCNEKMKK